MLSWLPFLAADPATDATAYLIRQGVLGALVILGGVFIGYLLRLLRQRADKAEADAAAALAAERQRSADALAEERKRHAEALAYERARADRAEARADAAIQAKSELEREVRTETTRIMQTATDRLEDTTVVLRDSARRAAP